MSRSDDTREEFEKTIVVQAVERGGVNTETKDIRLPGGKRPCGDLYLIGSRIVNTVPWPSSLVTETIPPWAWMVLRAKVRPSPGP